MLIRIVGKNGEVSGSLITGSKNVYIPCYDYKFFFKESSKMDKTQVGRRYGSSVFVENVRYRSLSTTLTYENYKDVLNVFKENNIELADFLFIQRHDLTDYSGFEEENGVYVYSILYKGNIVGAISSRDNFYKKKRMFRIKYLFIEQRGNGIGREVVSFISKYKDITGISLVSSHSFWKNCGADFHMDDMTFDLIKRK